MGKNSGEGKIATWMEDMDRVVARDRLEWKDSIMAYVSLG